MSVQLPLVFFGSGPVAASSLALIRSNFEIEAIVTKPSTATEMQLVCPNVQVYSVQNRTELDKLIASANFRSQYAILVDFGVIISTQVIKAFRLGIINSHFSLLPQWRGADPITFSILSGQKTTGVSLMLLVEKMDEGPLIAQSAYAISAEATTPSLTESLITVSDAMINLIVPQYLTGQVVALPQEAASILRDKTPSYSRRLSKSDSVIDWTKSAIILEREIRAYIGWPKSRATIGSIDVILIQARVLNQSGKPGQAVVADKRLLVHCGEGTLEILRLKPIGKPEMAANAFLAGYRRYIV